MNINLKRCKKCGEGFDIGTNYNLCPKCRNVYTDERRLRNYERQHKL